MSRLHTDAALSAPLHVTAERSATRHRVTVEGELDVATAPILNGAIERVARYSKAVVLDLAGVSFIDSAGVHAVSSCERTCRRRGVDFALSAASPQVRRVFELVALTTPVRSVGRLHLA